MKSIANAWVEFQKPSDINDYLILFGNRNEGWNVTKEELPFYWKLAVKSSSHVSYGDVTLLYKNKLIRTVNNFNNRLLDKSATYKCIYKKYNYGNN